MEKSDLRRLKHEVLDFGPEAALPANLPDAWLSMIARDIEVLLNEKKEEHCYLSAPLALTAHILLGKHDKKDGKVTFSEEELLQYLAELHFEVTLEVIRRSAKIIPEPATLKTIFTGRDVHDSAFR